MTAAAARPTGVARYRQVLGRPGMPSALVVSVVSRLPIGMATLGLLLLVQDTTGSFPRAGLVSGATTAALALVAPVRGRAADRRGGRRVLVESGLAFPVAFGALAAAVVLGAPLALVLALALVSGAAFPPVGPVVRALWGRMLDDEGDRLTMYALDSVLVETAFILGPAAVGTLVLVSSPLTAVVVTAVVGGAGALALALLPAMRALDPHPGTRTRPRAGGAAPPPGGAGGRDLLGAVRSPGVGWLLGAIAALGVAFGLVEVATAAVATDAGRPGLAGPLLALWGLGSAVGGLTYGSRTWPLDPARQYPWLALAQVVGLGLLALATGPAVLGLLLLVAGTAIAPFGGVQSTLLARLAPAGRQSEAFAWSSSGLVLGIAVGGPLGGVLVEVGSGRLAFVAAAGAAAVTVATAVAGRRSYGAAPLPTASA